MSRHSNRARELKAIQDRREKGHFVPFPLVVLRSEAFARLSAKAVKLLIDLLSQYNGTSNNGDFCAAWTIMARKGWRSRDTLGKALHELEETEFVTRTRQGGKHLASLYGVTFFNIDYCGGKLDVSPTKTPSSAWHKGGKLLQPPSGLRPPWQQETNCPAPPAVLIQRSNDTKGVSLPAG